jgi:hypothetical protein
MNLDHPLQTVKAFCASHDDLSFRFSCTVLSPMNSQLFAGAQKFIEKQISFWRNA